MKKIAIIGCGNMGGAIARGLLLKHPQAKDSVYLCDASEEKLAEFAKEFGVFISKDVSEVVRKAEVLLFALKPYLTLEVLAQHKQAFLPDQLIVSVAAGVRIAKLKAELGASLRYARAMPNLPCLIAKGVSGIYAESALDQELVCEIFSAVGSVVTLDKEQDLDAVTGLSGSGPAFIFYMIDALAKGGEDSGLARELALELASQTALGAAELLRQSAFSPQQLIEQVSTPGGTTLAGLKVFEEKEVASALRCAVAAATKRAREQA